MWGEVIVCGKTDCVSRRPKEAARDPLEGLLAELVVQFVPTLPPNWRMVKLKGCAC